MGLDKKLYSFDSGTKRPSFCIPYESPFSSVAFRDDGNTLAAGTTTGLVVFYDVRARPQPVTVLRAYANSEVYQLNYLKYNLQMFNNMHLRYSLCDVYLHQAVTSLSWQRLKPIFVNERSCTPDTALMGGTVDDSIVMPDPLPSSTTSTSSIGGSRNSARVGPSPESATSATASGNDSFLGEETPLRSSLRVGVLGRLNAPRGYNYMDDMDVFSPVVEVQPITPSFDKLFGETKTDFNKKNPLLFPPSKRVPFATDVGSEPHSIFDWKPSSSSIQVC